MNSKLNVAIVVVLLFAYFTGRSQTIEIIPSYGYQFGTKLNYGPNYLKAKDSDQFGFSVAYGLDDNLKIGLAYTRMGTELRIRDRIVSPSENSLSDLNFDWFQLGATRYFQTGQIRPFLGGGFGFVVISPQDVNRIIAPRGLNSTTRIAFSFKGGINIMFSDRIGLNLQGNLFVPIEWGGVYVAGGSGGVGAGVSAGSTTVMGGFSAGLVFLLGD